MNINGKKWTALALVLVAIYGAASAVSAAVGCSVCTQVLTGFQAYIPEGKPVEISATAIISGTEVPITGVIVSDTAAK